MCDRSEELIGFLYNELGASEAQAFRDHLASCADCRTELAALRATRGHIAAWTPPEPDLDFHIVRRPAIAPARPPVRTFRISPVWGLAAAATLVMAIGAAIANLEVRVGAGEGLVIRTGWNRDAAATPGPTSAAAVTDVDYKQLDQRLRQMEQAVARDRSTARTSAEGMTDEEILQRVREMVGQSETRQQRALAARLMDVTREFDTKRRTDLIAFDQALVRLQNTSGAEVRQYREYVQRMGRAAGVISTSLQK
jgi:hypothetical protein